VGGLGGAEPCGQGAVNALRQRDCEREGSEEAATHENKWRMEKNKCKDMEAGLGWRDAGVVCGNNRGRGSRREGGR